MTAQSIYTPILPTVLMVKKHNKTGMLYLCKTERINEVYSYLGSGLDWLEHLKKFGNDVSTIWVSDVFYDTSIKDFALYLSSKLNVVESNKWANRKPENGLDGGFMGKKGLEKLLSTINDSEWKSTIGLLANNSRILTMNDSDWKATIGAEKIQKQKQTLNDSEWKSTIGVQRTENLKQTLNDSEWKATTGVIAAEKIRVKAVQRQNDPVWKETIGKTKSKNQAKTLSQTLNDPEWKEAHYKTCKVCCKGPMAPHVFARWHKNC